LAAPHPYSEAAKPVTPEAAVIDRVIVHHHHPMSRQPHGGALVTPSEWTIEIDRLVREGPRARAALVRIADRADWRGRVLAVSALGRLVRDDRTAHHLSLSGSVLARIPGFRRRLGTTGPRGRLISRTLVNAASDRSFIVRTAAALALAECRDPALTGAIACLLSDAFRPVRCAAAVALVSCRGVLPTIDRLDDAPEKTPELIADGVPSLDWLQQIVGAHLTVIGSALTALGGPASAGSVGGIARWLAGPLEALGEGGASAEAARYDDELDLEYQLTKPFSGRDRAENLRQLDAFIALVSQLDLPRGARVVDLGGGSGWAGELLARFGFRPVVIDVALPLLRLARRRLGSTSIDAAIVAADMTALPLSSGSVDAVMAIDALHHVEDLEAILCEARRVLAPGGLFLLAEPGEGHAESPKSLAEAREHGVRESEIHPRHVQLMAGRAGFDRVSLIPRVPLHTRLEAGDLQRAAAGRVAEWRVTSDGREARFDTLVLRTMLARPVMVLSAGARTADTRAPGVLSADVAASVVRSGERVEGTIDVRNAGDTVWLRETPDGAGAVWIGIQLLDAGGRLVNREFSRVRLVTDVQPGERCRVAVRASLPDTSVSYRLKIDLVAERVCWFEDRGSRAAYVDV
jgi:SAM-dependent methyltransferase